MTDLNWLLSTITGVINKYSPYVWHYSLIPINGNNEYFINRFTFETPYFNPIDKFNIISNLTDVLNDCISSTSYNLFWTSDINTVITLNNVELPVICLDIIQSYPTIYQSDPLDQLSDQLNSILHISN